MIGPSDTKIEMEQNNNSIECHRQSHTTTFHVGNKASHHYKVGDLVGQSYELKELIGRGGMGVVYRAEHNIMHKNYALKLLAPNQINDQSWRRFEVEGRALARLKHDNIVTIYNMGVDRGQFPYFVMDWLPGVSLADRICQSGALSESETLSLFLQICAGLDSAHTNGIIHRDIKPANIMLVPSTDGHKVKIVDFGMARLNNQQALTSAGEIFGSPLYMSPEQCLGEVMDARSDIYSLGCSLFECLTGKPPLKGESALSTLLMHQEQDVPRMGDVTDDTEFSGAIEAVVAKCLRKDREQRYQSVDALAIDLQRLLDGQGVGRETSVRDLDSDSWRLFDDDSKNSENCQTNSQNLTHASIKKLAMQTSLGAITLLAVGAATYAWTKQIQLLPKADLNMATQLNKGHSTGNITADIYEDPEQIVKDLKSWPKVSLGKKVINGQLRRCFALPTNFRVASLSTSDEKIKHANGNIDFPASEAVSIRFDAVLGVYPPFIDKIAADDIAYLRLTDLDPADAVLTRITNWKIAMLMIDGGSIKDAGWTSVDRLPNLQNLIVKKAVFDWQKFVQLSCLKGLHSLRVDECSSIAPLLENLPVMDKLLNLDVGDSRPGWITSASLRGIARQKNLEQLFLTVKSSNNNRKAAATLGVDIEPDKKPKKKTTLSHEDITVLASMKKLRTLRLPKPDMTEKEMRYFLTKVPAARGNDWAAQYK